MFSIVTQGVSCEIVNAWFRVRGKLSSEVSVLPLLPFDE